MTDAAKQTISITRALTLMKGLKEKIDTAITSGQFVAAAIGEKNRTDDVLKTTTARIQGSHDKVISLMNNRNAIKSAVVKSNAETTVAFRGTTITVAEAIEQRTNTKAVLSRYLQVMLTQLATANMLVERAEMAVKDGIDRSEKTIYGREGGGDTLEAEMTVIRETQRRANGGVMVDPVGIQGKIDEIREHITDLDGELDSLLSESNAKTTITISV